MEFGDQLRRILQVGINNYHGIAMGMVEAGGEGNVLAEIARQAQYLDGRIARPVGHQPGHGVIAAAVVDADDIVAAAQIVEHRLDTLEEEVDAVGLVEHGNDHGDMAAARRRNVAVACHGER